MANSRFLLVNILLRKFDTSSKKKKKNYKNTNSTMIIKALSNIYS